MTYPNLVRSPSACVIDDRVHVFVGSAWQNMPLQKAEAFLSDVQDAVEKLRAQHQGARSNPTPHETKDC